MSNSITKQTKINGIKRSFETKLWGKKQKNREKKSMWSYQNLCSV